MISSRWSPVRLPCKSETNHMQCVDLSGVLFVLHETALFALCPVPNALFPATWIYFSRPRWVPESPCDVTSFAPLPFSAQPTTLIGDAVTLPKTRVAAAFRTWYLTFLQYTLLKEFHTLFIVWKQEPSEHFGRQTISAYYAAPEVSCRDDASVFNFDLVSPDCYYKRMHRVIATMLLPHVWKALNLNVKNKPLQLHVQKCFSQIGWGCPKPMSVVGTSLVHWHLHCFTENCEGKLQFLAMVQHSACRFED